MGDSISFVNKVPGVGDPQLRELWEELKKCKNSITELEHENQYLQNKITNLEERIASLSSLLSGG